MELTPLTHTLTGVGYYVYNLSNALAATVPAGTITGFVAGLRPLQPQYTFFPYKRLPIPPRLLHRAWDHFESPKVDRFFPDATIFHAVNYVLPPLKKIPGVLSIHDLAFLKKEDWATSAAASSFTRTIHKNVKRATTLLTCSQATKKDIVDLLGVDPDKVRVTYYAANPHFRPVKKEKAREKISEALNISEPYVLYVGSLEKRKNIPGLLQGFAAANIPHRLLLVGPHGKEQKEVLNRCHTLKISNRVTLISYIHDRALFPALYSAADAFLFPSFYEGFGLPVLEAMACGCPVITSNSSSLPEIAGEAALYVDPYATATLTDAIQRLLSDRELCEALRSKGMARAACFSWEKCAQDTLDCYRRVV